MFYLKSALTATVFVSVGSYRYKKSNTKFSFIRMNVQTALQQVLKLSITFLKTSIHPKFCYLSEYVVVLFYTFLSGYVLLNVSQTAANSSAQSYIQERTHVLLMYTTGMSRGVAGMVSLIGVPWGRSGESVTWGWTSFCFVPYYFIVVRMHFKWYTLVYTVCSPAVLHSLIISQVTATDGVSLPEHYHVIRI
jgi:hypothetical protein